MKPERVLLPTDFSEHADSALAFAVASAKRFGAELHVLNVRVLYEDDPHNPAHHFPDQEQLKKTLEDVAKEKLADIEAPSEINLVTKTVRGISAGSAIVDYAKENGNDLIVMGTRGRTGVTSVLLGSTTGYVVRNAKCSVLAIPPGVKRKSTPKTLLVGIDFSDESKRALSQARELTELFEAKLIATHVIENVPHPAFYLSGKDSIFEVFPDLYQRCRDSLEKLVGQEVEIVVAEGRAHAKLTELAREHGVELIVMGTHGFGAVERLLVGSVTAKTLRTAPCPVLSVK